MKFRKFPPGRALRAERAFSIAEIIISMALIIMLSVLGFTACYIALGSQRNASRNLEILSAMDGAVTAFEQAAEEVSPSAETDAKLSFLLAFHEQLAFALDSYVPNVRGMSESAGYGWRQNWQVNVANRTATEYTVEVIDGAEQIVERTVTLAGLNIAYNGAESGGYGVFSYFFFTEQIEVRLTLNLVYTDYYTLSLHGYRAGSDLSAFDWEVRS